MKPARGAALLLLFCAGLALAQAPDVPGAHGSDVPVQQAKHSVVLVSLDGFRSDYARRYGARNLLAIAAHGASAPDGMIPSYPATTLPNQYTLVTGLYPEHHGIVAERFFNAEHTKEFRSDDPASSTDGSWYGGTPLWALAEQQGMHAACAFWAGCGAAIGGSRPSLSVHSDSQLSDAARVDQGLAWLKLPAARRPSLIVLAMDGVDRAGQEFGPDSPQTRAAVKQGDAQVGRLRAGIAATKLPIDFVVVSDHGMAKTEGGWIDLDTYTDLLRFKTAGALLYAPDEAGAQQAYEQLKIVDARFRVYRRADVPRELHFNTNPRAGDPVLVPAAPVAIRAQKPDHPSPAGLDGLDPRDFPQMRAIFYAEGPDVRAGVKLKPFENTNLYPFVAEILGLGHPRVDGSASVLSSALKDGTAAP